MRGGRHRKIENARSLCDRLADERYQTIQFQCSPYHTNTALYPAINFLRQAAGLASQDSAQAQLNKLEAMGIESGIDRHDTVSLFADLLSIREISGTRRSQCHPKNART